MTCGGKRLRETPGMSDHEVRDWLGHANITDISRRRVGLQQRISSCCSLMSRSLIMRGMFRCPDDFGLCWTCDGMPRMGLDTVPISTCLGMEWGSR